MSEHRYAILIGNSQFPAEPKLQTLRAPENDVDGLNEVFTSKDLGDFTEVYVLKNETSYVLQLKINEVLEQAHKGDFVVIYYSGHGKLDPAGRLHLATRDTKISALQATSIPIARVRDFVDTSQCNQVALILDCCYSGAAGKAFARGDFDEQLQLVSGGRGTYVMTASTAIQIAQELETDQNGLFTKHIIEGIRTGEADLDQDGIVLMDELYRYVHQRMRDEGFQQPMRWNLDVRGDIVIARTGKSPREARRATGESARAGSERQRLSMLLGPVLIDTAYTATLWTVISLIASSLSHHSQGPYSRFVGTDWIIWVVEQYLAGLIFVVVLRRFLAGPRMVRIALVALVWPLVYVVTPVIIQFAPALGVEGPLAVGEALIGAVVGLILSIDDERPWNGALVGAVSFGLGELFARLTLNTVKTDLATNLRYLVDAVHYFVSGIFEASPLIWYLHFRANRKVGH